MTKKLPHNRAHLGFAIVIAIGLVSAIFAGIQYMTRIPEPEAIFAQMLSNIQLLSTFANSTDVQFTLRNEHDTSIGGTLRIETVTASPAETEADYASRISGQIKYRSGETRHAITGTLEARVIAGRYFLRLEDFQLSNELQPKWQSYLNIFKNSWYLLPADTLDDFATAGGDTLTAILAGRGALQPSEAHRIDRDTILLTAQLDPDELITLSRMFLVSRSIAPPPTDIQPLQLDADGEALFTTPTMTESVAPRANGSMDITLNAADFIARDIRGELMTETAIFGGSDLTASWQTKFKNFNTAPAPSMPPDSGPPSEVVPEGVIEFDLRTLF